METPPIPSGMWSCVDDENPKWGIFPTGGVEADVAAEGRTEYVDPNGYNDAQSSTGVTAEVVLKIDPLTIPIHPTEFMTYDVATTGESFEGGFKWTTNFSVKYHMAFEYGQIRIAVKYTGTHLGDPWESQTEWFEIKRP